MQFVERVKTEIHQRRIPSSTGGGQNVIDSSYNPLSINEDYFFPQTAEGRGSKVETLPGGTNLGEIDDLRYFTNKLVRGLRIPSSYLPTGADDSAAQYNDGRVGTAYIQELRFNTYCERLQNLVVDEFSKEFKVYLLEKGVNIDTSMFDLKFQPPQNFASYRQAEIDNDGDDYVEGDSDVDPGLEVIYGQMKNFGLIDDLEDGQELTEDYLRSKLPEMEERAFLKSIEKLSPDTQELLQYAFNNAGQDTPDKLREFFNKYVEPTTNTYEENPKAYLKNILLQSSTLMTEKDIEEKLEDWEEEGVLENKAKTAYELQKAELDKQKEQELKSAEENRKKQIERLQQFSQNVNSIVEQQQWGEEKQEQFVNTVRKAQEYNQMISSNPKAYVQMINFLSYFNPEKGEFDLDNWIAASASTKEANEKTKKMKQDLLSSAISRVNKKSTNKSKGKKSADPLEVIITPEMQDLIK